MEQVESATKGVLWRIIGTIIIVTGFLVGSLIYVGFYAASFDLVQKVIVVLVALILAIAATAIIWVSLAGRRGWIPGKWQA